MKKKQTIKEMYSRKEKLSIGISEYPYLIFAFNDVFKEFEIKQNYMLLLLYLNELKYFTKEIETYKKVNLHDLLLLQYIEQYKRIDGIIVFRLSLVSLKILKFFNEALKKKKYKMKNRLFMYKKTEESVIFDSVLDDFFD